MSLSSQSLAQVMTKNQQQTIPKYCGTSASPDICSTKTFNFKKFGISVKFVQNQYHNA